MPVIPKPVLIIKAVVQTPASGFENVSYWSPVTPPTTSADMNAIAADFNAVFAPLYKGMMSANSSFQGCRAEFLTTTNFLNGTSSAGSGAGTLVAGSVGDEVAAVIQKNTGFIGRRKRGRYFIGGLDQGIFNGSNPNEVEHATYLPLIQALASAYGADQTLNGIVTHARHWDRVDAQLVPIANCTVASRLATRRDRRRHSPDFPE